MKNYKGFAVLEGLLILVIVGILGATGWYVYSAGNKATDNLNSVGSKSDPILNNKHKPQSTSTSQASSTPHVVGVSAPVYASGGYLTISRWKTKIAVDDSVAGLSYTITDDGVARFRNTALNEVSGGCNSNSVEIVRGLAGDHVINELGTNDGETFLTAFNDRLTYKNQNTRGIAVHIGDYYYVVPDYSTASCTPDPSLGSKETDAMMNIVKAVNKMVSD